ncbi:hypothetical protein [Ornithobacterium rhinotracheale]
MDIVVNSTFKRSGKGVTLRIHKENVKNNQYNELRKFNHRRIGSGT